jgi:hypothetical protein
MNSKPNGPAGADLKRRGFLLAGSVGAAGAVVAVVTPTAVKPLAVVAAASPDAGAGYVESAHVRTYYELARV